MRVAFIQKDPLPDPALMTLGAAVAFRGHEAECFLPRAERDLHRAMRRFAPAAVVFMPPTGFHAWALQQAASLRACTGGAPHIFTGSWATDHPGCVREPGVDLVMVGDPETTLPEILWKILKERELPGTSGTVAAGPDGLIAGAPRAFVDAPDELPLMDLEIYRRYGFVQRQTTLAFATGRGVLENTHAGFTIGMKELRRRFRPAPRHSVAEVIERVHLMVQRRPRYRRVAFKDDTLLLDPHSGWLQEVLERYRNEIALPFSCVARPDQLDAETVARLAKAGCRRVLVGVESGDAALREACLGVAVPDEQVIDGVGRLRAAGLGVWTVSFFGVPGETAETADATVTLNRRLRPDHAFGIPVMDEPGSAITPELARLAHLLPLATGVPGLSGLAGPLARLPLDRVVRAAFQAQHDLAFVASDELTRADVVRIAAGMGLGRSTRPARPVLQ
jgi:hypothetical protein